MGKELLPSGEEKGAAEAEELQSNCRSCCSEDKDQVPFARAILYVCPFQLQHNQDVEDFVKRKAGEFKNLQVRYADGARTTIQLLREGENEKDNEEYVNIKGWKSDEIYGFVKLKV